MILVGLTGGIGSGKSTVSRLLAERGAVIVDADAITRELQQPGQPVLAAIVERFGEGVLTPSGELDRAGLAAIVFADADALADLNRIVHPAVGAEMARRIERRAATPPRSWCSTSRCWPRTLGRGWRRRSWSTRRSTWRSTVWCAYRGMNEDDARARIARQASREERAANADRVVDNSGGPDALEAQVDELWTWLQALPQA